MSVYCHCMQYAWIHLYIISALFKIKLYGFVVILMIVYSILSFFWTTDTSFSDPSFFLPTPILL